MSMYWGNVIRNPVDNTFGSPPPPLSAVNLLLLWLDQLDAYGLPQPGRKTRPATHATLCLVQFEIERATGATPTTPAQWQGGGDFPESDEAYIRAVAHVFLSLLVADQWDRPPSTNPNQHTHAVPNWLHLGGGPDNAGLMVLVGMTTPPFDPSTVPLGSVLGRIRSALGC